MHFKFQMDYPFSQRARKHTHTHTHTHTLVLAVKRQSHVRKNPPLDIPRLDVYIVSLRPLQYHPPIQICIFHLITNLSELLASAFLLSSKLKCIKR